VYLLGPDTARLGLLNTNGVLSYKPYIYREVTIPYPRAFSVWWNIVSSLSATIKFGLLQEHGRLNALHGFALTLQAKHLFYGCFCKKNGFCHDRLNFEKEAQARATHRLGYSFFRVSS